MNYRFVRRLIIKNFGSWRNFVIWIGITSLVIYLLDLAFYSWPRDKRVWDGGYLEGGNVTGPPGTKCGVTCPENQYAFYIKTGTKNNIAPTICFEDVVAISPLKNKGARGINMVVIDGQTKLIKDTVVHDTYVDDTGLIRYVRSKMDHGDIVLLASFDEISSQLKDSRAIIKQLGSYLIDKVKYRESFLMIGQRNLASGKAIEYHQRGAKGFTRPLEKSGCFSVPMGPLNNIVKSIAITTIAEEDIQVGATEANCGVKGVCAPNTFPIYVSSGYGNEEMPSVCMNGKYYLAKGLNNAGRGFNVMVIDTVRRLPVRIDRFDTYEEDSSALEIFLEALLPTEMIVIVTADDASKKLSYTAKQHYQNLGSSRIETLRFRDAWYFIGRRGLKGFTYFEQISYAGPGGKWPKPISQRVCVPDHLTGTMVLPDPQVWRNDERREFCKKYDGYVDFCDPIHVDDLLRTVPLVDKAYEGNVVYKTPIILIPGMNHNSFVKTLETTLMQSGLDPNLVTVMWDEKFEEYSELAAIFGFKSTKLASHKTYESLMVAALLQAFHDNPEAEQIFVVEEDLLLAADFLSFHAQCVEKLHKDPSILAVSAWNPNGYAVTSGNKQAVYQVEEFPGLAFMIKKSAFQTHIADRTTACCTSRAWAGWELLATPTSPHPEILIPDTFCVYRHLPPYQEAWAGWELLPTPTSPHPAILIRDTFCVYRHLLPYQEAWAGWELLATPTSPHPEILIPDTSRVYRQVLPGSGQDRKLLSELLSHPRATNLQQKSTVTIHEDYDKMLTKTISEATIIDHFRVDKCQDSYMKTKSVILPGKTYVINYTQTADHDYSALNSLCACFKLFHSDQFPLRGLHKSVLRFTLKESAFLLVGSRSALSHKKLET